VASGKPVRPAHAIFAQTKGALDSQCLILRRDKRARKKFCVERLGPARQLLSASFYHRCTGNRGAGGPGSLTRLAIYRPHRSLVQGHPSTIGLCVTAPRSGMRRRSGRPRCLQRRCQTSSDSLRVMARWLPVTRALATIFRPPAMKVGMPAGFPRARASPRIRWLQQDFSPHE
jgi:hypothetical protein